MQKFIRYIFFLVLTGPLVSQPYLKIQNVNAEKYPYVNLDISVSNVAPIENLNETHFSVFENRWKAGFFRIKKTEPEKNPKRIVLLIDSSMSLSKEAFESQIHAASMLVNSIYQNDEVSVVSFHDTADIRCGFTNSREQLNNCVKDIRQNGKYTVLYDAVYKSMKLLSGSPYNRNFIILFTDGKEEESAITIDELVNFPDKSPLFIVGAGKSKSLKNLARLAHVSGGEIYASSNLKNVSKIYSLLQVLMDNTYQLEYLSQEKNGGRTNQVEVRFEYDNIRDQDHAVYGIPEKTFLKMVSVAVNDERFMFFVVVSLLLLVIIIVLATIPRKEKKSPEIKKESVKSASYEKVDVKVPEVIPPVNLAAPREYPKSHGFVIQKEGPLTGDTHQIKFETTTIGHGNENSIVIDDPTVSYTHAKIVERENNFYIYDMLSESGVYVNGKKILKPRMLNDFDEIKVGRTVLLFRKAYK